MTDSKTDFPVTRDWLDVWAATDSGIGTSDGRRLNVQDITIKAPDSSGYNMMMTMSVMKQVKGGQTNLWWGYSSQVNYKTALKANTGMIQNFVQLWEQDEKKKTNYLNFMCQYSQSQKQAA